MSTGLWFSAISSSKYRIIPNSSTRWNTKREMTCYLLSFFLLRTPLLPWAAAWIRTSLCRLCYTSGPVPPPPRGGELCSVGTGQLALSGSQVLWDQRTMYSVQPVWVHRIRFLEPGGWLPFQAQIEYFYFEMPPGWNQIYAALTLALEWGSRGTCHLKGAIRVHTRSCVFCLCCGVDMHRALALFGWEKKKDCLESFFSSHLFLSSDTAPLFIPRNLQQLGRTQQLTRKKLSNNQMNACYGSRKTCGWKQSWSFGVP